MGLTGAPAPGAKDGAAVTEFHRRGVGGLDSGRSGLGGLRLALPDAPRPDAVTHVLLPAQPAAAAAAAPPRRERGVRGWTRTPSAAGSMTDAQSRQAGRLRRSTPYHTPSLRSLAARRGGAGRLGTGRAGWRWDGQASSPSWPGGLAFTTGAVQRCLTCGVSVTAVDDARNNMAPDCG